LFTQGSPEKTFSEPIRLDLSTLPGIAVNQICFSGLATFNPTCAGGTVYFVGTRVR
jgi:hypothetical protein